MYNPPTAQNSWPKSSSLARWQQCVANLMAHLNTQFSRRVRKCAHHSTADDLEEVPENRTWIRISDIGFQLGPAAWSRVHLSKAIK